MSCAKKNVSVMNSVVRIIAALPLLLAALFVSPVALAVDSGDIVVVSLKGEVHFTVNGAARAVRAGGVLEPPATLRTGRDGSVELKQRATTVSVGPETLLEFPALEKRGAPVDRILQPRGNAFYNIGKREGRKLRVETPYLVGVVKGTQFNVAAQDEATTISLFEGLLEVRATDDSDVVDLKAGEIASRKRGDKQISVMKMDSGKAPATAPRPPAGVTDGADVRANASTNVANAVNASAAISVAPSGVDVAAGTRVNAGPVAADTSAAVNVSGGAVDVSTSTNVAAGPVSVDTSTAVNAGTSGVDLTTATTADAGPIAVDVGASTAVDLTTGTVDLSVDLGLDATGTIPDTSTADTGADTGSTNTVIDVGGLLDGLLRRPGRR